MPQPSFSVIIAAYQAAEFIGGAVTSALEQVPPPLEVIVGDDGSTDDLGAALAHFGAAVRVVRIEHAGEAAAKNAAASVATGDFLAFLDADDRFVPGRLQAIADLARAQPELDVITTDAYLVHDGKPIGRAYDGGFRFEYDRQREAILRHNFVLGNAAVRRSRFEELGGFDPGVVHTTDWEFCIRLILSGSQVGFIDRPLAEYHLHPGSMSAHRVAMARGRLETISRTAARDDLSAAEREILESTRAAEERRLTREVMKRALLEGSPRDSRRAAAAVLRSPGELTRARLKALAVIAAPSLAAHRHRVTAGRSFATVGDRRLTRGTGSGELRSQVAFGIRWGAIDQVGQFAVRIAAMIALARLLSPHEIGIMALATIVLSLGSLVVGVGVGDAIVQRRTLDEGHVAVSFLITNVTGLLMTGATIAAAGSIAAVFDEPRLRSVLIVVSVVFALSGFERTPNDVLVREMRFRDYYISSTIGTAASAVVAVSIAAAGGGVWALVAMAITESAAATFLAWVFATRAGVWSPRWAWDGERARSLMGFGAYVTGSRVVAYVRGNADNVVVGKVLGSLSLGYYSLAYRTIMTPVLKAATILGTTAFAVFSTLQDDLAQIRRGLARANAYVALVCFPATIGVAVTAPLLVPAVFGSKWTPAVVPVEILALLGPYFSFMSLDGAVFQAVGKANLQLALSLVDLVLVVVAVLIGVDHGIKGVAIGVVIASYLPLPLKLAVRNRLLQASLRSQLAPVAPVVAATAGMAALAVPFRMWVDGPLPAGAALVATIAFGGAVYGLALRILAPRLLGEALRDFRRRRA